MISNIKAYVILVIGIIIISCITFTLIYYNYQNSFDDALYLSVQIQSSVGIDATSKNKEQVKNWITVQSIITYILNITIVIILSEYFTKKFLM